MQSYLDLGRNIYRFSQGSTVCKPGGLIQEELDGGWWVRVLVISLVVKALQMLVNKVDIQCQRTKILTELVEMNSNSGL
ncbi:unnamed protein product, partial [Larinioides sclopetarius]